MVDIGNDAYGNANSTVHGLAGAEDGHQAFERPRVNLKPRSQPLEPMERITEKERLVNCLKAFLSFYFHSLKYCSHNSPSF